MIARDLTTECARASAADGGQSRGISRPGRGTKDTIRATYSNLKSAPPVRRAAATTTTRELMTRVNGGDCGGAEAETTARTASFWSKVQRVRVRVPGLLL